MNQLKVGIKIEREHKPTINYIKKYIKTNKKLPPNTQIYKHIVQNHIAEHKNYYFKLKKAKL